jgi:hypothetical protein
LKKPLPERTPAEKALIARMDDAEVARNKTATLTFLLTRVFENGLDGKPSGEVASGVQSLQWHVQSLLERNFMQDFCPAEKAPAPYVVTCVDEAISQCAALLWLLTMFTQQEIEKENAPASAGLSEFFAQVLADLRRVGKGNAE